MSADEDVFDVIVIGAGPVGETAVTRAVRGGLTAAVVERRLAGGECGHYGCIPSKALLWPMELAAEVSRRPTSSGRTRAARSLCATIAVTAEVSLDQLWQAVPVFSTASEIWLELLQAYGL